MIIYAAFFSTQDHGMSSLNIQIVTEMYKTA